MKPTARGAATLFFLLWISAAPLLAQPPNPPNAAVGPSVVASGRVTLRAAGRGNGWIGFNDGVDLSVDRIPGDSASLSSMAGARPLSLAAGDFDEDRIPDLISGYAGSTSGFLMIHRGNVNWFHPTTPEVRRLKALGQLNELPLLGPARTFAVPVAPDFLFTGNFTTNPHTNVILAARGGNAMYLLPGDGHGGFGPAQRMELPGAVTALVTGEINRADGGMDIVVAVKGPNGPQVMVFESPLGAWHAQPEVFPLPAEATALALGRFAGNYTFDLAVAAGSELVIIQGRDRRLSLDASMQAEVPPAQVDRLSFPFAITALAGGDFSADHHEDLVLLSASGELHLVKSIPPEGTRPATPQATPGKWETSLLALSGGNRATQLVRARVSRTGLDDLILFDGPNHQLHFRPGGQLMAEMEPLEADGEPVAVLPMRLQGHAMHDLVLLQTGHAAPTVALAATGNSTVTTTNDSGPGSLRQAILDSNANPPVAPPINDIVFSIPCPLPPTVCPSVWVIQPKSPLPDITQPVVIGLSTNRAVEIDGSQAGAGADGLVIQSPGKSSIGPLSIYNFKGAGIRLEGSGNAVDQCAIGTDSTWTKTGLGNGGGGIVVHSANNIIGGFGNIISGNGVFGDGGVVLSGAGASMNRLVNFNRIGTVLGPGGTNLPNGNTVGVLVTAGAANNVIGVGDFFTPPGLQIISGNSSAGILIDSSAGSGNLVQSNSIGTGPGGLLSIPNRVGLEIDAIGNTAGGTLPFNGNFISANAQCGVIMAPISALPSDKTLLQGNSIGIGPTGTPLPNGSGVPCTPIGNTVASGTGGVLVGGPSVVIGGAVAGTGNVISGNNGHGVKIQGAPATGTIVQGNFIGTDATGTLKLPNFGSGVTVAQDLNGTSPSKATIGGTANNGINPNFGANAIANNSVAGVSVTAGVGIQITQNSIHDNFPLPIDLLGYSDPQPACGSTAGIFPNNFQVRPVLTSASAGGVLTNIQGMQGGPPGTPITLEFFSGTVAAPSLRFLGSATVTTGSIFCTVPFNVTLTGPPFTATGLPVVATATDAMGDTSEYSDPILVGVTKAPTTTTLKSSLNPSAVGQAVTFTAQVRPVPPATGTPTGQVAFRDGTALLGNGTLDSSAPPQATLTWSGFSAGPHSITAFYGGDGNFTASTSALTQNVCPVITILPATLANGTPGAAYLPVTFTPSAGAARPVTFSIVGGALPAGMTLAASGLLSGTPTQTGTFNFTIQATDANNCTGQQVYTLKVCPVITVSPAEIPTGTVGKAYPSTTFTPTGGFGTVTFTETGALPTGMTLAPNGVLSGTPTQSGSFPIKVIATDANGCPGSQDYTLIINSAPGFGMNISPSSATAVGGQAAFTVTITPANGLSGNMTFTCSVTAPGIGCGVTPPAITLNGPVTQPIVITLSRTGHQMIPPLLATRPRSPVLWPLALLATLGLFVAHRWRRPVGGAFVLRRSGLARSGVAIVLLLLCWLAASCSRLSRGLSQGNYNVTLTATSGTVTHTVPVIVVVK